LDRGAADHARHTERANVLATRALWLVYPREAPLSLVLRAAIEFVVEVMNANAARLSGLRADA
jgi:hypothetical protein